MMSQNPEIVTRIKVTPSTLQLIALQGKRGFAPSTVAKRFVKVAEVETFGSASVILNFAWHDGCGLIWETLTVGQIIEMAEGIFIPTEDFVTGLAVGDLAPDYVGRPNEVTNIYGRGIQEATGYPFVCYYTKHGDNGGQVSNSVRAGKLHRSASLVHNYTSNDLWCIDQLVEILSIVPMF